MPRRREPQPNRGYGRLGRRSPQGAIESMGLARYGGGNRLGQRRRMSDGQGAWRRPMIGPPTPGVGGPIPGLVPGPLPFPGGGKPVFGLPTPGVGEGGGVPAPLPAPGTPPKPPGGPGFDRADEPPTPWGPGKRFQRLSERERRQYERWRNRATRGRGLTPAQIEWLKRRVLQRPENLRGTSEGNWFMRQIGKEVAQAGGIDKFMEDLEESKRWRRMGRDRQQVPAPGGGKPPPEGGKDEMAILGGQGAPGGQRGPQSQRQPDPLEPGERNRRYSRIDLPPELMPELAALEDELAATLARLKVERSQIGPMVALMTARLASQEGLDRGSVDESMAARGIYTSGIRTTEQGNLANEYNRTRQDLSFQTAGQYGDLASRESEAQMGYNRGLSELARLAAQIYARDRHSPYGAGRRGR